MIYAFTAARIRSLSLALAALLLAPNASPPSADDWLLGVWGSEIAFPAAARGSLTITRHGDQWSAHIAGIAAGAVRRRDSIIVRLPGDNGQLRARFVSPGQRIVGFWIQPAGFVDQATYASPLALARLDDTTWQGTVTPLEDRFSLYLEVHRTTSDRLEAVFRNPEFNAHGPAAAYDVEVSGDSVRFVAHGGQAHAVLTARHDSVASTLVIPWAEIGQSLALTKRARDRAVGFFPRTTSDTQTSRRRDYRVPGAANDGWAVARASAEGLDERTLMRLGEVLATTDPVQPAAPLIHSLTIARHGRLVFDEYFFGFDRERQHDWRSASKTFASILVGVAMQRGAALSPATKVYPLFGGAGAFPNPDRRKETITLAQLMTHTSGLACDENDDDSPGGENRMQAQTAVPDWYAYTLSVPMAHDPGTHYAYCSGGANLVGGVVHKVTGAWLPAYFDEHVAQPLQFAPYYLNLMPTGEGYLGGGARVRPRDMLKLGQLYLNGGAWRGHRIVSADWVAMSTARQTPRSSGSDDGYLWHRFEIPSGGRTFHEYEMNGNGGQFVIVLPELDLAVAITAGNYGNYRVWRTFREELLPKLIRSAVSSPL